MKGDNLEWDAPAGDWVIMRMGMRPTGVKNSPADPEATGLETDKMSRKHVAAHFEALMGKFAVVFQRLTVGVGRLWYKIVMRPEGKTLPMTSWSHSVSVMVMTHYHSYPPMKDM